MTLRCSNYCGSLSDLRPGFAELPEPFPGRADYRVLEGSGVLVSGFSVIAQLSAEGAVELLQLDIDRDLRW
jgi:hypothetical protein